MKFQPYLIALIISFLIGGCNQESKFERVPDSEINLERKAFATDIVKQILTAQKSGNYYPLTEEEATLKMADFMNESLQKESYQRIKSAFGEYQDITFDHLVRPKDGSLYEVYRFRGQFDPKAKAEVRATLDANGKLAGLFITSWKEHI